MFLKIGLWFTSTEFVREILARVLFFFMEKNIYIIQGEKTGLSETLCFLMVVIIWA